MPYLILTQALSLQPALVIDQRSASITNSVPVSLLISHTFQLLVLSTWPRNCFLLVSSPVYHRIIAFSRLRADLHRTYRQVRGIENLGCHERREGYA